MILKIRATMRLLFIQYVPDLLVVGTQEVFPEKTEWEVSLLKYHNRVQETWRWKVGDEVGYRDTSSYENVLI